MLDDKESQTCKVSGKSHVGIQVNEVSKKGKGVSGGGDLLRPRPGTRTSSSSHRMEPFFFASLAPMLLALPLFLWLEWAPCSTCERAGNGIWFSVLHVMFLCHFFYAALSGSFIQFEISLSKNYYESAEGLYVRNVCFPSKRKKSLWCWKSVTRFKLGIALIIVTRSLQSLLCAA